MSREKSEMDVRNVPITVRLNEEEHEKLKRCAALAVCPLPNLCASCAKEMPRSRSQRKNFGRC